MDALAARLQGGAAVADPLARFADRGAIFPWRPRRADADRQTQLVFAAVHAALIVYALMSPGTGTQPVVYSAFFFVGRGEKRDERGRVFSLSILDLSPPPILSVPSLSHQPPSRAPSATCPS
jgi:hypothetical protein